MKEFNIGGKITISENESYRIIDIVKLEEITYYYVCTTNEPITPKIFERINDGEDVYLNEIKNPNIVKKIVEKILKSN